MCTTSQFFFVCNHAATDQFRDGVCTRPDVPDCYREPPNIIMLPNLCVGCKHKFDSLPRSRQDDILQGELGKRFDWAYANEQPMNQIWQIPSRCFIDPGFQRHDPFAADRIKQEIEAFENRKCPLGVPLRGIRQQFNRTTPPYVPGKSTSYIYRWPPAPCCEGTMIRCWQGLKKLASGKHIDNRCQSGF